MSKLYIITGPPASGKTTISNALANKLPKSALIEGDELYHQVVGGYVSAWKEGNHKELFKTNCFNTIKLYLENGYDVVFNYVIEPNFLEDIKRNIPNYECKFILLLTNGEELLKRDSIRPLDCQMKERCLILLEKFKNYNYSSKNIIDTSKLSVDEIVDDVIQNNKYLIEKIQ